MRRRSQSTTALALALALCYAGAAYGQHAALEQEQPETYLRRRLQQAKPDDPFPEGPNVVCWDYSIAGEQGANLTADQVCCWVVCGVLGAGAVVGVWGYLPIVVGLGRVHSHQSIHAC